MPTREQLQEVFVALVRNGLDFIERSSGELDKEQKYSIAHFATGLELLLKARLFHEHWTLIAADPHKCSWSGVKDGTLYTLGASELCAVITTTTGTALRHEGRAFDAIFKHRNRVLHWTPDNGLASTVAEQCVAWHYLRTLLAGQWAEVFGAFKTRIEQVEHQLRTHRTYLEVKFRQIEPSLKGPENAGRLFLCASCDFAASVAADGPGRVLPLECRVCGNTTAAARFDCGAIIILDNLPKCECACGEDHDRDELLNQLDPMPLLSPKEMSTYVRDRGYCGECFEFERTVACDADHYVCVNCGTRFEPGESSTCEACDERWFGWDSDDSYYMGCEQCDGHDGGRE